MTQTEGKKLTLGILAHVDAGKTTLTEALLYLGGVLKKPGRVDHQTAFLDTDALERQRGITIFAKQALLPLPKAEITLLDTPGHVDFSSEMERTLAVLDYAVLVISGTDGIQGHTLTLWRLLARQKIPVFLFINKTDLPGTERTALLTELKKRLDSGCVDFSRFRQEEAFQESLAMAGEAALEEYLSQGQVSEGEIISLIAERKVFPCYFGSALHLQGVEELLKGLAQYSRRPSYPEEFGARIFKIARDPQGNRLTFMKITGGVLKVKTLLTNRRAGLAAEQLWEEKADQIRIYSGEKYEITEQAAAGTVCAVTGLSKTRPGQGLGWESAWITPFLEPVLTYRLKLPPGCDPHSAFLKLAQLEEEDPQLHLFWNPHLKEIQLQPMGEVQLEILKELIFQRFGLEVSFGAGNILYRETIAAPVEGMGHFEPLRHYAEVHLLLEPGKRGSGLQFATTCSEDMLDRNWQRLILTHLAEREHPGVLTGSPITDMKITLTAGRGHNKHTEGGDFRQATYRAIRQGLLSGETVLLEPWYDFRLELPAKALGRAMSDLRRMSARLEPPENTGEEAVLSGAAPVSCLRDYPREVHAYTQGRGRLFYSLRGYEPCHNQEEAVRARGYDWRQDTENTGDSVFCSHGAGFVVKWDQAPKFMHVSSGRKTRRQEEEAKQSLPSDNGISRYTGSLEQDKELQAIFEKTYGAVKRREFLPTAAAERESQAVRQKDRIFLAKALPEYLLVDGYNILFAWDDLKSLARESMDGARRLLMDLLSNYQGFRGCVVILVFDAYKVPRSTGEISRYQNIYVVYTREAETADAYIERATYELARERRVRVATSDSAEQLIILGHGALRVSARDLRREIEETQGEIAALIARYNQREPNQAIREALRGDSASSEKK